MGVVSYSPSAYWPHNTTLFVTDFLGNDPRFVYYLLKSIDFRRYNSGSAQASLNRNHLTNIPVLLAPLDEQLRITALVGALDDKIELVRRMNETLDAMATALFKSWFVDFDPTRDKVSGRVPAEMDSATANLFPSRLDVRGPLGWRWAPYGEGVAVIKGKSYTSEELQPSSTALVTLKSFLRGGGYREDGLKSYIGGYKAEQVVVPGDLVVAFTDVTQAADVIGKPALVRAPSQFSTLVASLDVGIVRSHSPELPIEYLYYRFLGSDFQDHTYAHSNGSTVLHLAANAIAKYEGLWPSAKCVEAFCSAVRPMIKLQNVNWTEINTVAAVRDSLLPKLLSGELLVRDAERVVEAVA